MPDASITIAGMDPAAPPPAAPRRPSPARPAWLAGLAFALMLAAGGLVVALMEMARLAEQQRTAAELNAQFARNVEQQLAHALSTTYALAVTVRQGGGAVRDFEGQAREMLGLYQGVSALQLAPGGVIRHIAPLAGNERALGHNLLADDKRNKEARLAIATRRLTLAGPFPLIQGGEAVIGRLPVYLGDGAGGQRFWGFTIALLRLPDFLRDLRLDELDRLGYRYQLWRVHPDTGARQVFARSSAALEGTPVTTAFEVPNGRWYLGVTPAGGWHAPGRLALEALAVCLLAGGLALALRQYLNNRQALAASEAGLRLAATVFEHSHEGIMISDADNRILSVNRAFTQMTGYAAEEVVGRNPRMLASGRHSPQFYGDLWRTLRHAGFWEGEIWNRRKSGELYPEWIAITAVRDAGGRLTHHLGIFTDITERKAAEEHIRHLAQHDPLTGLPNRLLLADRVQQALARAARAGSALALLFLDLDHFKAVNDSLGHMAGDQLLVAIAERLRGTMRRMDTISRLGGDEFILLLPDLARAGLADQFAQGLLEALHTPFEIEGRALSMTFSIGVSVYPEDGADFETLLKRADLAMYQAKQRGRNGWARHAPGLEAARGGGPEGGDRMPPSQALAAP